MILYDSHKYRSLPRMWLLPLSASQQNDEHSTEESKDSHANKKVLEMKIQITLTMYRNICKSL
jgi:hypothetical protein